MKKIGYLLLPFVGLLLTTSCASSGQSTPEYPTKHSISITKENYLDYLERKIIDKASMSYHSYYVSFAGTLSFALYDDCIVELVTSYDGEFKPTHIEKCILTKGGFLDETYIISPYNEHVDWLYSISGSVIYWF